MKQRHRFSWYWFWFWGLAFGVWCVLDNMKQYEYSQWTTWMLMIVMAALVIGFFIKCGHEVGGYAGSQIRRMRETNVTPQDVELMLWRHYGRQPTIEEINAAYQMIRTQHDTAVRNLGITAGAVGLGTYFADKHLIN